MVISFQISELYLSTQEVLDVTVVSLREEGDYYPIWGLETLTRYPTRQTKLSNKHPTFTLLPSNEH